MSYLTTKAEIKEELRRNLDQLTMYPAKADDLVAEIAEGFAPVYNSEIIREWAELPADYSDRWKELGYDANRNDGGILQLMAVDLALYYLEIGEEAWAELQVTMRFDFETAPMTGNPVARCRHCEFVSVYWESPEDLEHDCTTESESE